LRPLLKLKWYVGLISDAPIAEERSFLFGCLNRLTFPFLSHTPGQATNCENLSPGTVNTIIKQLRELQAAPAEGIRVRAHYHHMATVNCPPFVTVWVTAKLLPFQLLTSQSLVKQRFS
jgi:hypothetical protein